MSTRAHMPATTRTPRPRRQQPKATQSQVEYTCPMHPQVRQMGPGNCPICGMALEPVLATAEHRREPRAARHDAALLDRHGAHGAGLRAGDGRPPLRTCTTCSAQQTSNWIQLLLGTPVVLWAGWPFFVRAVASVKNRSLNMFSLIALGTGAAWLYSIVGTVAPQSVPAGAAAGRRRGANLLRGRSGHHGAGAAGPGARAAGAREDVGRHQGAAGPGAEDGGAR